MRKVLFVAGVALVAVFAIYFISRNAILHYGLNKAAITFHKRFGVNLSVSNSSFKGFLTVELNDLLVTDETSDTLLVADTLSVRPSFWILLTGSIRLKEVDWFGGKIHFTYKEGKSNFSRFLKREEADSKGAVERTSGQKEYGEMFYKLFNRAFNFAPQRADLRNINFSFSNDSISKTLSISNFHSDENSLNGSLADENGNNWICEGRLDQSSHKLNVKVFPSKGSMHQLPLLPDLFKLSITFDSASFSIDNYRLSGGNFILNAKASINNFTFHHWRIADDTIVIPSSSTEVKFVAGNSSLTIDSSTVVMLNAIDIHPFVQFANEKSKKVNIKITTGKIDGTRFFQSLPAGMFDIVRGIEAEGTLKYMMAFSYDSADPEGLTFNSSMQRKNFRIKKAAGLGKMQGEFLHSVYENDRLMRAFIVGPSNPDFTPLDQISADFKNSVLTSEDGSFFWHNGFNEDAFRKSIITNIKAKRFVRGGSTISMQLVKNIFLTRKKTIARKAEEALIVWLIESTRLYSKERMFEVYLNIIELGPNIYGIGEASRFYFDKRPVDLNLREGIFLANLLPHPKWFKYSFDTAGNLKPYLADYYRVMANFMLKKELISQQQYDELQPNVELKGPAREMVVPSDTIPPEESESFF